MVTRATKPCINSKQTGVNGDASQAQPSQQTITDPPDSKPNGRG